MARWIRARGILPAAAHRPAAARAKVDKDRDETMAASKHDLAQALPEALGSMLSPADAAVLPGRMARYIASAMQDGLTPGARGCGDDCCAAVARPWGFALADISVPVLLLHGGQDGWVPSGTASGWPYISRGPRSSRSIMKGTCPSSSTRSVRSIPGSRNTCTARQRFGPPARRLPTLRA